MTNRGFSPDRLQPEQISNIYDDLVETLERAGYIEGVDLFVATYDWRLNPGPIDGTIDGKIQRSSTGKVKDSVKELTDNTYEYSVDQFAFWLKEAITGWKSQFSDLPESEIPPLESVDVIAHSAGGATVRSYIQSDAYGAVFDDKGTQSTEDDIKLPEINNFISLGVPYRGASIPWNGLNNNFSGGIVLQLAKLIAGAAYAKARNGSTISFNGKNDVSEAITPQEVNTGTVKEFIEDYVPHLRALLATYPFIEDSSGNLKKAEELDPQSRNELLLDLNDGFDSINNEGDRNPTKFADKIEQLAVVYGSGIAAKDALLQKTGPDFETVPDPSKPVPESTITRPVRSIATLDRGKVAPEIDEIWYKNLPAGTADPQGDETVPLLSATGIFSNDPNDSNYRDNILPPKDFPSVTHNQQPFDLEVQQYILDVLKIDLEEDLISTNLNETSNPDLPGLLFDAITFAGEFIQDPVEGFLVDGQGRRLGYTSATGAVTEIPNSYWLGEEDGVGFFTEPVEGPFQLELTGLGEDYFVSATVETEDGPAAIESEGFLAQGEQLTLDLSVIDSAVSGSGGNEIFTIPLDSGTTKISNFGGVGTGTNPSAEILSEVDILKFDGAGLTANNLQLIQSGDDLILNFVGIDNTEVILTDFALEDLDNLPDEVGNILFDEQATIEDNIDVFDFQESQPQVIHPNTVTFLTELDDAVNGLNNSNDTINGQNGNDTLNGGGGNDYLIGREGNDSLGGNAGDDTIEGSTGNDTLNGGGGNDTLIGVDATQTSPGKNELDILSGSANNDTFVLGDENNVYYNQGGTQAEGGQDRGVILDFNRVEDQIQLHGKSSDYQINSNASLSTINYIEPNSGVKELVGVVRNVTELDLTDTNQFSYTDNSESIIGTDESELIFGGDSNQTIDGSGGDDQIYGLDGDDTLNGNSGNDTVFGGKGDNLLIGGENNDRLVGSVDDDTLNGVNFNSTQTSPGKDELDVVSGSAGSDIFVLGDENSVYYNQGGTEAEGGQDRAVMLDFNPLVDKIQLHGKSSDYQINSNASLSTINYIEPNSGVNELIAVVRNVTELDLTDTNQFSYTDNSESIIGTDESELIFGGDSNQTIDGSGGDDQISGLGGDDTVNGGNGNDLVMGGKNNDRLLGSAGNDTLNGVDSTQQTTPGKDELDVVNGNAGSDTFVLGDENQVYYNQGGTEAEGGQDRMVILDFNPVVDQIQLHGTSSDYQVSSNASLSTINYIEPNSGVKELVGVVRNVSGLDLNDSSQFEYV